MWDINMDLKVKVRKLFGMGMDTQSICSHARIEQGWAAM